MFGTIYVLQDGEQTPIENTKYDSNGVKQKRKSKFGYIE